MSSRRRGGSPARSGRSRPAAAAPSEYAASRSRETTTKKLLLLLRTKEQRGSAAWTRSDGGEHWTLPRSRAQQPPQRRQRPYRPCLIGRPIEGRALGSLWPLARREKGENLADDVCHSVSGLHGLRIIRKQGGQKKLRSECQFGLLKVPKKCQVVNNGLRGGGR